MIRYHGLPLTPTPDMLKAFQNRHAMVSYFEPRQIEHAAEVCSSITIDCGTYSAYVAGVTPDFTGYVDFCRKWLRHPCVDWVLISDLIDGSEEQNDKLLFQFCRELRVPISRMVPVWHYHESFERLVRLMREFPRIALGSSGKYKDPGSELWWQRTAEVMPIVCDSEGYPLVQLHGCRMLNPDIFSHVPLASGDSTNVARNSGIDKAWTGPYVPKSVWVRALVMMDRIDNHGCAARWCGSSSMAQRNMELLG
jgi:hypothetical protein